MDWADTISYQEVTLQVLYQFENLFTHLADKKGEQPEFGTAGMNWTWYHLPAELVP